MVIFCVIGTVDIKRKLINAYIYSIHFLKGILHYFEMYMLTPYMYMELTAQLKQLAIYVLLV